MGNISPCVYPRCDDGHGDPRLTQQTICDPCRHHYRKLLDWIVLDYITIRTEMPKPVPQRGAPSGSSGTRSYGHPTEWASITTTEIASALNWIEDGLRDHNGDDPPPHPFTAEHRQVAHAHQYLTLHLEDLATYPGAQATAAELNDLHRRIRATLGHTRIVQRLPTPCPRCDVAALTRHPGGGTDQIDCGHCRHIIRPEHYGLLTRMVLDDLIDAYDTQQTQELAS